MNCNPCAADGKEVAEVQPFCNKGLGINTTCKQCSDADMKLPPCYIQLLQAASIAAPTDLQLDTLLSLQPLLV